jgi:hypothetical protein
MQFFEYLTVQYACTEVVTEGHSGSCHGCFAADDHNDVQRWRRPYCHCYLPQSHAQRTSVNVASSTGGMASPTCSTSTQQRLLVGRMTPPWSIRWCHQGSRDTIHYSRGTLLQ